MCGWVGLGESADGLGWIGSHKVDPWTTVMSREPDKSAAANSGDRAGARACDGMNARWMSE